MLLPQSRVALATLAKADLSVSRVKLRKLMLGGDFADLSNSRAKYPTLTSLLLSTHSHTGVSHSASITHTSWRTPRARATTLWASTNMRPCPTWSSRPTDDSFRAVETRPLATRSRSLVASTTTTWGRAQHEKQRLRGPRRKSRRARGSEMGLCKARGRQGS